MFGRCSPHADKHGIPGRIDWGLRPSSLAPLCGKGGWRSLGDKPLSNFVTPVDSRWGFLLPAIFTRGQFDRPETTAGSKIAIS